MIRPVLLLFLPVMILFLSGTADFYHWEDYFRSDFPSAQGGTMEIEISGLCDDRFPVYISVFDAKDCITDLFEPPHYRPRVFSERFAFNETKATAVLLIRRYPVNGHLKIFSGRFAYGDYAVSVWQDTNRNHQFDLDPAGIPAEPWGASGNPGVKYRIPRFNSARFRLEKPSKYIPVIMKNR